MKVIKRDGSQQDYDEGKIFTAILAAFNSVGQEVSNYTLKSIVNSIEVHDKIPIEQIQDQVETALMKEGYYDVAKAFILYRQEHKQERELTGMKQYILDYMKSSNAATGSKFDSNANVTEKNVTTLAGELQKGKMIQLNRSRMRDMNMKLWGAAVAKEYDRMLESHELYKHDETAPIYPYCVAITMYPMLLDGLQKLGGISDPPKHLRSFCGIFVNMIFTIAAQFAGAVATPEFLMYFDYFCRKEWGDDYWIHPNAPVESHMRGEEIKENIPHQVWTTRSIEKVIEDYFQNVVYYLNQPAAARNFQSVFWNISYFDKNYFEGIFGDFVFPDGTKPSWESLDWLQRKFMKWFNKERTKKLLTFPVETMALLTDGEDVKDKEYADFTAEMQSEGHSFFVYMSDSPDSLSSCCRLRNEVQDNQFSYSLGAGGVATGSKSVMTLNINRLVQDWRTKSFIPVEELRKEGYKILGVPEEYGILSMSLEDYLREKVQLVHKFQISYNELLKEFYEAGMLTVYNAGFIDLKKQYLTIGVNGVVEAAEYLGIKVSDNPQYEEFIQTVLGTISEENKKARTKELMFNTEFVPAENLGVKHARWDKEAGYEVPRECYNSYFYAVEDNSLNILEKFRLHGKEYVKNLDGGSALHMNLEEHLTKEQYRNLLKVAAREGTNYFTYNIPNTICNKCGHIDKRFLKECPECGGTDVDYATRVIGYLKRVSNFSEARQVEAARRFYYNPTEDCPKGYNQKDWEDWATSCGIEIKK